MIVFEYSALEQEMDAFARSADGGRNKPGLDGIDGVLRAIDSLKTHATRDHKNDWDWTQLDYAPIETNVSDGEYMPDSEGGEAVFARVRFVWGIRNYGQFRRGRFRYFELVGKCSTQIDLVKDNDEQSVVAMWKFEVASHDSPGCHFHTQILGDDSLTQAKLFPKAIDIPRLPSILVTPSDALEFVLGELFQDAWRKRIEDESPTIRIWRSHQQARLTRLLEWQRSAVEDAKGSPWIALKRSKPDRDLLVDLKGA